jgi:hypothetical protein
MMLMKALDVGAPPRPPKNAATPSSAIECLGSPCQVLMDA